MPSQIRQTSLVEVVGVFGDWHAWSDASTSIGSALDTIQFLLTRICIPRLLLIDAGLFRLGEDAPNEADHGDSRGHHHGELAAVENR